MMKKNLKNMKYAVLLTAAASFLAGAPAFGAEYVTPDAVLALETPGDDWKPVEDGQTWVTLSDGNDKITLLHYSNGEKLPEMTVAGNGYAQVCQNVISTENEVFVITGSAVEKEDFDKIREAVQSAVIQKYDTRTRVDSAAASGTGSGSRTAASESVSASGAASAEVSVSESGQKTIEKADFTAWVTSQQLNVRSGSSTDTSILGTVYYADAVKVTGIEKVGGAETGWYQINYNGTVGYVSAAYVSNTPSSAGTLGYTLTEECVTLYTADGSSADYVYRATNGNWYDGSGRQYQPCGSGYWICVPSGITWTETAPQSPADQAANQVEVEDEEQLNRQILYEGADGSWRNSANGIYTDNGDGTWTGMDGTVWYISR